MQLFLRWHYLYVLVWLSTFMMILVAAAPGQPPSVSGFVYDPNGGPVANADLDFDDAETGERMYTPGDNTDQYGFYRVFIRPGTYHISYAPPPLTHLLGKRFFDITLSSGQNLELNVILDFGVVISGTVSDSSGNPVGYVDLDADSLSTGGKVYTPNDNTDSTTGAFWIVVPPASYRLRFEPPAGVRWQGLQLDSLAVLSDTIIDVALAEGMLLSGFVTDNMGQGLGAISINLRFEDTGDKIYVANNKTDSTGYYNVAAPTGLFELRYEPPLGSRLVGVAVDSFTIDGDISRNQILEAGWLISAFVHDSTGNPIEGADLDFIRESTGEKIFTPHDMTDLSGLATISVMPDTYTIRVDPPVGSTFDRLTVTGVVINSDATFDFLLPEVPRVNLSGRVVNSSGNGLQDIEIDFADTLTGTRVYIPGNKTDSAGFYNLSVPTGYFNATFSPPRGSRYVGIKLTNVAISQDTIWSDVVLDTGLVFSARVYDRQGVPVEDVDFDFISDSTGAEIITPHDDTDSLGTIEATIPAGSYTIRLAPPSGSPFKEQLISGFSMTADTSKTFFLARTSDPLLSNLVLKQNFPNPFNQATSISYVLLVENDVSIVIYNALGQRIKIIECGIQAPDYYVVEWDGTDYRGQSVASGLYFYQVKTLFGKEARKMVLIR